jgi:hypothetical protein
LKAAISKLSNACEESSLKEEEVEKCIETFTLGKLVKVMDSFLLLTGNPHDICLRSENTFKETQSKDCKNHIVGCKTLLNLIAAPIEP